MIYIRELMIFTHATPQSA